MLYNICSPGLQVFSANGWQVCFRSVNPPCCYLLNINKPVSREQGWHGGESTRLLPMWLRFKSWRRRHIWVEFVVGSLPMLQEAFLRVLQFSPLLKNQHFQIPIRPGIRQMKNHYVDVLPANRYLFIYLFILFISSVWRFIQRSLGSARTDKPFIPCVLGWLQFCGNGNGKWRMLLLTQFVL